MNVLGFQGNWKASIVVGGCGWSIEGIDVARQETWRPRKSYGQVQEGYPELGKEEEERRKEMGDQRVFRSPKNNRAFFSGGLRGLWDYPQPAWRVPDSQHAVAGGLPCWHHR